MKKILNKIFEKNIRIPLLIIFTGIIIRLLFMPSSVYLDLLSATWRENLWVSHGVFKISDLPEVFLASYFWLVKPLIPGIQNLIETANSAGRLDASSYQIFASSVKVGRYLFVLKLPFLLLNLGSLVFLWKMFDDQAKRLRIIAAWAIFPFLIYAVYIWGRYEIFPIFFMIGAFYFTKNKRNILAALFVGLAVAMKVSFILFLPFFLIYLSKNWRQYVVNGFLMVAPAWVLSNLLSAFGAESLVSGIDRGGFFEFATYGQLTTGFTAISITIIIYFAVLYLFFRERNKTNFKLFISFTAIGILSYFAFSKFHSHYLSWITPVFLILISYNKKIVWPLVALVVCYLFLIDFSFGSTVTFGLFRPLDYSFFGSIGGLSNQAVFGGFDIETLGIAVRTFFVMIIFWICALIYKERNEI